MRHAREYPVVAKGLTSDCSFFGGSSCDRKPREYTDEERAEGLHLDDR